MVSHNNHLPDAHVHATGFSRSYRRVQFRPGSGNYLYAPSVRITSACGTVYHTTDGSDPANSNTAIADSDRLTINRSGMILAAAHSPSDWSGAASAAFNIGIPGPKQSSVAAPPKANLPFRSLGVIQQRRTNYSVSSLLW
jgi:hypothetical protein